MDKAVDAATQAIATEVRGLRARRGLTQAQLGLLAGVSGSYIGQLERGRANPTLARLVTIARALEVPASELLGVPPSCTAVRPGDKCTGRGADRRS